MIMFPIGTFIGGVLVGSAGLRVLSSKDAKRVYAHTTAAVLRAADDVMACVSKVRADASDVLADAKEINANRAPAEVVIEDQEEAAE